MFKKIQSIIVVSCLFLAGFSFAQEKAKVKQSPDLVRGRKLFRQGKLKEALEAFRDAAEKDPSDKLAVKYKVLLTRVLAFERLAKNEKNPKWDAVVSWLHRFYSVNRLYSRALPLDKKAWEKFKDFRSGVRYAETLSSLGKDKEALGVYEEVLKKKDHPAVRSIVAVYYARAGNKDVALEHVSAVPKDIESDSVLYNLACVYALLGDRNAAAKYLKRAFEMTPANELERAKAHAKKDPDLKNLVGTEEFAVALKAESKVKARKHSCGSGACGSCKEKDSCKGKK